MPDLDRQALRQLGLDAGLHAVGFTHAEPFHESRIVLEERRSQGLHGGMQFTYRNPERSTTPKRILETANTLVVGAWPYAFAADSSPTSEPQGEIAAYAWRDHYGALRNALETMAEPLRSHGFVARVVADDNALVDRAAAIRAGLGWAGKNSNVLLGGRGSWYVLGAIVTDAEFAPDTPVADQCGSCRRCIDGCPTGAIVADGVVDARRCLAWLLQREGSFPLEFRKALGTRIYGCDECQVVCPPSRHEPAGLVGDETPTVGLLSLLKMTDDELIEAVGRWYIPRRDPRFVRRNALVALGNSTIVQDQRDQVAATLGAFAGDPDASQHRGSAGGERDAVDDMLAEHARWAMEQLGMST